MFNPIRLPGVQAVLIGGVALVLGIGILAASASASAKNGGYVIAPFGLIITGGLGVVGGILLLIDHAISRIGSSRRTPRSLRVGDVLLVTESVPLDCIAYVATASERTRDLNFEVIATVFEDLLRSPAPATDVRGYVLHAASNRAKLLRDIATRSATLRLQQKLDILKLCDRVAREDQSRVLPRLAALSEIVTALQVVEVSRIVK